MRFFTLLIFIFSMSLFSNEQYIDNITYSKVQKLVKKEEQIAKAYKRYIALKGISTSLDTLISDGFLPDGFSNINPFGHKIEIDTDTNQILDVLPVAKKENEIAPIIKYKTNIYDYYYSNENRKYSKAPFSSKNNKVNIQLNTNEKYILKFNSLNQLTTKKSQAKNKYYLDAQGILHWYDGSGNYSFTFGKDLIVNSSIEMLDSFGNTTKEFDDLFADKNALYAGQTIFHLDPDKNVAEEHLNIGGNTGIIKVGDDDRDIGETIVQFTRRAGGMIINGDIYTWGNNANRIVSLDKDDYTTTNGSSGNKYPVITGLVRARAKVYDDNSSDGKDYSKISDKDYFSSPLRPKFVDFFSAVYYSTCGVSTKGELYCGGTSGANYSFGNTFTHVDSDRNGEMLYRSTFFDGKQHKAKKIFANNQIWLILSQDGDIYRWGYDWSGFSGNGNRYFNYQGGTNTNKKPEKIGVGSVRFDDVTYLLTIGYRKMGALSTTGDVYIWGMESQISDFDCTVNWQGKTMNLCKPMKVEPSPSITFKSIKGGLEAFVGISEDGKYYKIHQPKYKKPLVESLDDAIKVYNNSSDNKYVPEDDNEIISVDLSSRLDGSSLKVNEGIVWINGKNELKGDYFTYQNKNDEFFKSSIKKIKWKKIKVIEDDNGMCGIDIYNQMYCWGIMSYYRNGSGAFDQMGNTFMLPVFNTNLYDLNKDYLVAEGGNSGYLSNMTSHDWSTTTSSGKTGAFFMKYPTYIGGFNYEFIFK